MGQGYLGLTALLHPITEDLESRSNELTTGRTSLALPAVGTDLYCTSFARANDIPLSTILLINPVLSLDEQRATFSRAVHSEIIGCFSKNLVSTNQEPLPLL